MEGLQSVFKPGEGKYLITTKGRKRGDILASYRPLITVFGSRQIVESLCAFCIRPRDTLFTCTGCRQIYYCSRQCQKAHWQDIHKLECKILARMQRNMPVGALLCVIRALLLSQTEKGHGLLDMEAHITEQVQHPRFDGLDILVRGISAQVGEPDLVKITGLYHRLIINSIELVTDALEPLRIVLDPMIALLNHSCAPNAYITFDGPMIRLHAFRDMVANEAINISYIDVRRRYKVRQTELRERYYFDCKCTRCARHPTVESRFERLIENCLCCDEEALATLHNSALSKSHDMSKISALGQRAERILSDPMATTNETRQTIHEMSRLKYWSPMAQPLYGLYMQLIGLLVQEGDDVEAAKYAIGIIDWPVQSPVMPNDLVHLFKTMQLLISAAAQTKSSQSMALLPLRMATVAWYLACTIKQEINFTHGPDSTFTKVVAAKVDEFEHDLALGPDGRRIITASRQADTTYIDSLVPIFRRMTEMTP